MNLLVSLLQTRVSHALATRALGPLLSFIQALYTIDANASPTNHAYV
jgi:hypothetical protein